MKLSSVLLFGDARAQFDDFEEKLDVADERFFGFGLPSFGSAAAGAITGASGSVGGGFGWGSPAEIDLEETTTTSYYETSSTIYSTTSLAWAEAIVDDPYYYGIGTCKALVDEKTRPEADEDCRWSCRGQGTNIYNSYNPKGSYLMLIRSVEHYRQTYMYNNACKKCVAKLEKIDNDANNANIDRGEKSWRNGLWVDEENYCPGGGDRWCPSFVQSNFFYLTDYGNDIHCYHKFASECKYGVEVTIREMRIEKIRQCRADYIAFGYINRDGMRQVPRNDDRLCGCLESPNVPDQCEAAKRKSTDDFDLSAALSTSYVPPNTWYNIVPPSFRTTRKIGRTNMKIKLLGTDPIFTFESSLLNHGGEVVVEWQCMPAAKNRIWVHFNLPVRRWFRTTRSEFLESMKEALLQDANKINPYGKSGDAVVKVTMSDDGINVTFELNGIPDEKDTVDADSISKQVSQAAQSTLSAPEFKDIVDANSISVEVKLPATVTNTEEMAEKILVGTEFTPDMATNYGCASAGFFDPFTKVYGKPRDTTDAAFFKWKKCIQCALGDDAAADQITKRPYDFNEKEQICGKFEI